MKKLLFLLIILGCLLFCGCAATADIEYGIDFDNTAYTKLNVEVHGGDLSYSDKERVKSALRDVAEHYRDLGFECDFGYFTQNENKAYIHLTKEVKADSFEQAFENLKDMLCDDSLTAFSEISCEGSKLKPYYAYRINGRVDLHRVLENTYDSGIAQAVADYTAKELEGCSLSVTLSLPENTKVHILSLTEPTEISHSGKVICAWGSPWGPAMRETVLKNFKIVIVVEVIYVLLSFIGIMIGAVLMKKGKGRSLPRNGEDHNVEEDQDPI